MSSESSCTANDKGTARFFTSKMRHIKKMLKTLARLLTCRRTVAPDRADERQTWCAEVRDNAANEALEGRLRADLLRRGDDGEVLAAWLGDRLQLVPARRLASGGPPSHFARTASGDFAWAALLPDRDIWRRGDELALTARQTAQQQAPTTAHAV